MLDLTGTSSLVTGGASEATCLANRLTMEGISAARDSMPYEGATDTSS